MSELCPQGKARDMEHAPTRPPSHLPEKRLRRISGKRRSGGMSELCPQGKARDMEHAPTSSGGPRDVQNSRNLIEPLH